MKNALPMVVTTVATMFGFGMGISAGAGRIHPSVGILLVSVVATLAGLYVSGFTRFFRRLPKP